jgi:hypothetical protein
MVTRPPSVKSNASIEQQTLRALCSRNPHIAGALNFLFANAAESPSFQELRVQPRVGAHRNLVSDEPFLMPKERSGGSQDIALIPFMRTVVDETLRAYSATSPHLLEFVGKTPISPYGSLGLSVNRWGQVDWDYIRDLDWRIFLPPEIGHRAGFKSLLEQNLTEELQKHSLHPVMFGKDAHGEPQVQLRDIRTGDIHGFHFFLTAMTPGFVRGSLHEDGGYSPHLSYFPEWSLNEHLESANLLWSDVITQLREDYIQMFNQLSFNIFAESEGEDRLYKTRGWYLHKAFKWYATLARLRGLDSLEEDLLYQYEHFRGAEAELSYLARYRYYARLTPIRTRLDDVDRDLARAASVAYARARNSKDPLIGQKVSVDNVELILLEMLPESLAGAARRLLLEAESSLPGELQRAPAPGTIRFADNLAAPCGVHIDGQGQVALIPGEWSMVYCDSYIGRVAKRAAEEKRTVAVEEIRQALAALLASQLSQASQVPDDSSGFALY